jgi:hypothetical protein
MRRPEERYMHDASYHTLVNLLESSIESYGFTRRDLVEAVNLAVTFHNQEPPCAKTHPNRTCSWCDVPSDDVS